jgi:heme/copper-type cytochrome/quinol oxidase subunit 4
MVRFILLTIAFIIAMVGFFSDNASIKITVLFPIIGILIIVGIITYLDRKGIINK